MFNLLNIFVIFFITLKLQSCILAKARELPQGCSVDMAQNDAASASRSVKGALKPHLVCINSNENLGNFNWTGTRTRNVKTLTFTSSVISGINVDFFQFFPNLVKLELSQNQLAQMIASEKNISYLSVTSLSLTQNRLSSVPNEALKIFPNLKDLYLYNNRISVIQSNDFLYNVNLKRLFIGPNPIKQFNSEWLLNKNLATLGLRGCGLKSIPTQIASMQSLESIDLSENEITEVSSKAFVNCSALTKMDLSKNHIKLVQRKAFDGASALNSINFTENAIETLLHDTFKEILDENIHLDLLENPINCNCSMAWLEIWKNRAGSSDISSKINFKCEKPKSNFGKQLHQLKRQDFNCRKEDQEHQVSERTASNEQTVNNEMKTCLNPCICFDEKGRRYGNNILPNKNITEAENLKSDNVPSIFCTNAVMMEEIPQQIRTDVKEIFISRSKFKTLRLSRFEVYEALRKLTFTDGELQFIKYQEQLELPAIKMLNLNNNKIDKITKEDLQPLSNIEGLFLSYNFITDFPEDTFNFTRNLKTLHLSFNPVEKFNGRLLKDLPLENIVLRHLSLTKIPHTFKVMKQLEFVDLRNNRIRTIENETFSDCSKLHTLLLEGNEIVTVEPKAFRGADSLRVIRLSGNNIKTIATHTFTNIDSKHLEIGLWANPIDCTCPLKGFKEWVENREFYYGGTEVGFQCWEPLRLHGQTSVEVKAERDLDCSGTNEESYKNSILCNASGRIATAVFLSLFFAFLLCFIIWRCLRKRVKSELHYFAKF